MMTLMTLTDLAQNLQGMIEKGSPSSEQVLFSGISQDSRYIKPGDVFIVIPGDKAESYTRMAIKAGAVALVAEPDFIKSFGYKIDVPIICVASARMALSQAAVLLYPGQPKIMVAVTGTNGKTSVVTFVRQIWEKLGYAAASFGTLGVQVAPSVQIKADLPATKLNTPDALLLHQRLQTLAASNITHCVFEASSHGLDQYRMHGVKLEVAGFTNFSQDHLDYHATMDDYFEAKVRLFLEVLPSGKPAVINVACSYYPALKAIISGRGQSIITYGVDQPADLTAKNVCLKANRIHFDLVTKDQTWTDLSINMVGAFQIENVLCAIGLVHAAGAPLSLIVQTLTHLQSAPGRMELVGKTKAGSSVFIDYAHTPDALQRALEALRKHIHNDGRLRVVFGCGGNRDAAKRAQMGEIAQQLADDLYVTDDNPRDEDPAFIRAQILVACPQAQNIDDRRLAIKTAIQKMHTNDILLIAGKGHEQGQIIGDRVIPFDDRLEAQAILKDE
jgi:UDP-N-acetylmuramoyl-L-alanyl-D-glutamate--2,6-diaminopimelate ligase